MGCFLDGPRLGSHDLLTVIEMARITAGAGGGIATRHEERSTISSPAYHAGLIDHDWLDWLGDLGLRQHEAEAG